MGASGAGWRMPRVSEAQGCCSIDAGRQDSISWCDLLNSLVVPRQARPWAAFTPLFIYLFPSPLSKRQQRSPCSSLGNQTHGPGRAAEDAGSSHRPARCPRRLCVAASPRRGWGHAAAPGPPRSGMISSGFNGGDMNLPDADPPRGPGSARPAPCMWPRRVVLLKHPLPRQTKLLNIQAS